nr:MAG TPA: hypothetical protein [Microviridae sp.]
MQTKTFSIENVFFCIATLAAFRRLRKEVKL